MVNNKLLAELKQILKEEFNVELSPKDLTKFSNSIVGYFDLLAKIDHRSKHGKS